MTDPVFTPLDRDEVISYLGGIWPPQHDATTLTLPPDCGITDGAVAVYPTPGRPGITWWAVDSLIGPQSAGVPDDALVALLPGSVLNVPAPPDPDEPPPSPPFTD
jgi:hypothetical protein